MSMSHFSTKELAEMRATQDSSMMDLCYLQVHSRAVNTFGELVDSWTTGTVAISCGLEMKSGRETLQDTMTVIEYDGVLRLPVSVASTINEKDRVEVYSRFGEELDDHLVFGVAAPIQRGPSGIRILVKRIEI